MTNKRSEIKQLLLWLKVLLGRNGADAAWDDAPDPTIWSSKQECLKESIAYVRYRLKELKKKK